MATISDSLNQDSDFSRLLGTLVAIHSTLQRQAERSVVTALVARNWLVGISSSLSKEMLRAPFSMASNSLRGASATNLKQVSGILSGLLKD